jgi:hypothetical protein
MNHSTRVMRRPRRAGPPAARTVAAIIATAALALLPAACSSGSPSSSGAGGSPDAGGSASSPSALAYSQCMRSHGVPDFPDPPSGGGVPKGSAQQFGVSNSQYQAAQTACEHLLPAGPNHQFPAGEVQQVLAGMRTFAKCMRSHGVPNWPDPSTDSNGQPVFDISSHGITPSVRRSPQVQTTMTECQHLLPSALGPGDPPLE